MNGIFKYGLIVVKRGKILLQKENDATKLLLPGGRPKMGENPVQCLTREIMEELGTTVNKETLKHLGTFQDVTVDGKFDLTIELYQGELMGIAIPQNEVEEIVWFEALQSQDNLSPIIRNKILPFLVENHII